MKKYLKSSLSEREKFFCYHYMETGNVCEAAIRCGFVKDPQKKGILLLSKDSIKKEIDRIYSQKRKSLLYKAFIGYERLAFGSVADAVKLLYIEKIENCDIEKMNLFNISEIKRPKDGTMEIKFFDRIRALEKLEHSESTSKQDISPFYQAIEKGFKSLEDTEKDLFGEIN